MTSVLLASSPLTHRVLLSLVSSLLVAAATRKAHRRLPVLRYARLLALSPCLLLLLAQPLLFDSQSELLLTAVCCACLSWWAVTKVALVGLGRSPLPRTLSLPQYSLVLLLPLLLASKRGSAKPAPASSLAARAAAKLSVLALCTWLLSSPQPPLVRNALYTILLFCFLGAMMDGPASLLGAAAGLRLAPHFDAPFLARSHADWWAARWNLVAGTLLRMSVYEPALQRQLLGSDIDGADVPRLVRGEGSRLRRSLALCLTFFMSGVAHEIILRVLIGNGASNASVWTLEWLLYFTLQGPMLLLEAAALKPVLERIHAPVVVRVLITLAAQLLLASWLFFPPAVRSGLAARTINSLRSVAGA